MNKNKRCPAEERLPSFRLWLVHRASLALIIAAMACSLYSRNAESAKPGQKLQDCPECPEMVVVPPGSFRMGSPSGEAGRSDDEGPVHTVTIRYPFAVGVYEVTFDEWDHCVKQGGCRGYSPDDEGWGRGNRPVINVNLGDAQAYIVWLSQKTGKPYRLLTEAEWEYAARAGTTTPFHFGSRGYGIGGDQTAPAGSSYLANNFGLHDVHGNVWEWVEDCWHDNYEGAPTDGSAWTEGGDCDRAVIRGGSWVNRPRTLRSANRGGFIADDRYDYFGFRVALTLTS